MYPFSNPSLIAHIKLAQEFYIQDKLNEAMEVVTDAFSTTGWPIDAWTDFYNTLVCEKDARDSAVLHKVHDKLSIELDLDAPPSIYEDLKALTIEAMRQVRDVLEVEWKRPVMITIFRPDAAVAFISGSYGYVSHKTDKDKVCFPYSIVQSRPKHIMRGLVHELTHVAEFELADDQRLPHWFGEGLSTFLCGDTDNREARFHVSTAARSERLLGLEKMEALLVDRDARKDEPDKVQAAYFLAGSFIEWWVGRFGLESVRQSLVLIGEGQDHTKAIRRATKMKLSEMENKWIESLHTE